MLAPKPHEEGYDPTFRYQTSSLFTRGQPQEVDANLLNPAVANTKASLFGAPANFHTGVPQKRKR